MCKTNEIDQKNVEKQKNNVKKIAKIIAIFFYFQKNKKRKKRGENANEPKNAICNK